MKKAAAMRDTHILRRLKESPYSLDSVRLGRMDSGKKSYSCGRTGTNLSSVQGQVADKGELE